MRTRWGGKQSQLCIFYVFPIMNKAMELALDNKIIEKELDANIDRVTEDLSGDQKIMQEIVMLKMS